MKFLSATLSPKFVTCSYTNFVYSQLPIIMNYIIVHTDGIFNEEEVTRYFLSIEDFKIYMIEVIPDGEEKQV